MVQADHDQLCRLFSNLLDNALTYRGDRLPVIRIDADRDGAFWRFAVSDNGIGIEDHYLDRIFQIFQRLHARADRPGHGLGLAICKEIVMRHGGNIWAESEPGKGSRILFTVPAPEDVESEKA